MAETSPHRTMKVVVGYVPRVDQRPRWAQDLGFDRRVAFVLETYRPDQGPDMFFDLELYAALLQGAREVFQADRMVVVSPQGRTTELAEAPDVVRLLELRRELDREPLEQLVLRRGDAVVASIGSEPWANAGGPSPYHDSYTVPIYSSEDRSTDLIAAARATRHELGAVIEEVIHADAEPTAIGWPARLRAWFRI